LVAVARLLPHPVPPQVTNLDFAAKKAVLASAVDIVLAKKLSALLMERLEFVTVAAKKT
jgi:hypothetical protein